MRTNVYDTDIYESLAHRIINNHRPHEFHGAVCTQTFCGTHNKNHPTSGHMLNGRETPMGKLLEAVSEEMADRLRDEAEQVSAEVNRLKEYYHSDEFRNILLGESSLSSWMDSELNKAKEEFKEKMEEQKGWFMKELQGL